MKIKFCGAAAGVTGSCHLLSTENHKILLDCGQFQGGKAQDALNEEPFPFDPAEIEVRGTESCAYRPLRQTAATGKERF